MSVLWRSLDSMMTSPPEPPSPPEGPPRGTNFSRRKATQPLPPSPALTLIFASSINMVASRQNSLSVPLEPTFRRPLNTRLGGTWPRRARVEDSELVDSKRQSRVETRHSLQHQIHSSG